jgi:hypothetical protein
MAFTPSDCCRDNAKRAHERSGPEPKAARYQERVRAIAPAMICIITPTTHPIMISIVP